MKKSYAKEIARIALVLAGAGAFALALLGCPTDAGGGGGGKPQTGPDAEDFGPNAVIAGTFIADTADALQDAIDAIRNGGSISGNIRAVNTPNFILNISGNITMDEPIEIDDFPCNISFRGTGTITFTGRNENTSRLVVQENQTFILRGPTLKGSGDNEEGIEIAEARENGTFVLRSGTINANSLGKGIQIAAGGRVEMYGGTITGATGLNQDAVWEGAGGVFIMSGGNISGNGQQDIDNITLSIRGTFTMTGGSISGNANRGVTVRETGTVTMTGGSISNNAGGGVLVKSGGTFNLNPPAATASISGNTNYQVRVESGGTFKVNGTTTIGYN